MQYIATTTGKPYKIITDPVEQKFDWQENGDLKITETIHREVFFNKTEAMKAQQELKNKLQFHETEISDEYKVTVQKNIDAIKFTKDQWDKAIEEQEMK